ncbi:hypothetical protein GCM10009661_49760 [Catellatospora chokoriensis]|uniref:Uncharacterized protein n=1 Tax=Catellatospora chokoriensis TaxID=310353 RepID=A0A8J3NW70_9ACTN|nr:hypothetical protein Cch02nite_80750 [Catellatospora chokoriensis]
MTWAKRQDQTYHDARRVLDRHRPAVGGRRCDQARCAREAWPCAAVVTAHRVLASYGDAPAAPPVPAPEDTARVWLLTSAAYEVPPTAPLITDMGNVMELMHRMGTVSLAQIAVRLGRPRPIIALILRALAACGWVTSIAAA